MLEQFYRNKKVLITGHTGFKGSWLTTWLTTLGAEVIGVSINVPTEPSNYVASRLEARTENHRLDVTDYEAIRKVIHDTRPDFVFHLAAQALVRPSYESPLETINTNVIGSANILDSLRVLNKDVVAIMITSDKVYDNVEWVWGYRENDRLGGVDPYSASKGMAELVIRSYFESFFREINSNVRIGIARAGNVIGGGDWATDRLVADCVRAWSTGKKVDIRSSNSTRPWQHVLEPLSGYLWLGAQLTERPEINGEPYNFGPRAGQNQSVRELIDGMAKYWKDIQWNDISGDRKLPPESVLLKLNCDKSLFELEWQSTLDFNETIKMTVEWYQTYYQQKDVSIYDLTVGQISSYTELAKQRGIAWSKND